MPNHQYSSKNKKEINLYQACRACLLWHQKKDGCESLKKEGAAADSISEASCLNPAEKKPKVSKKSGLKASLIAKAFMLALSAAALTSCSSQSSSSESEQVAVETKETDYPTISDPDMEKRLSDGSAWKRLADDLTDENLSSISFDQNYYSMELADGKKISGEYAFLEEPENENKADTALILFKELSSDGDVIAKTDVVQNEEGTALTFTFAGEGASEVTERLGLTEQVLFYDQASFKDVHSKEEARQQQLERQQKAQRLREENGADSSDTDLETVESSSSTQDSEEKSSTLKWDDATTFLHSPGAGGYHATLYVEGDGSFIIESTDHDAMQVYYSLARGKLSQPRLIDDTTAVVDVESITFYPEELPSDLDEGLDKDYINFDVTENFPDSFTLYLPDTPISSLDDPAIGTFHLDRSQATMGTYGLTDHKQYYFFEANSSN